MTIAGHASRLLERIGLLKSAKHAPPETAYSLAREQVWSAVFRREEILTCKQGVVWLTQTGDIRDYVLAAGETFQSTRRGRIAVTALEDSLIVQRRVR